MADIRASIEEELNAAEGVTWKECLVPGNRYRFLIVFMLFLCQQFSGTNSIGYYAPEIFQTVGLSATNTSLFATGVYGTVKVISTGLFLIIGIDKFGRRWSLMCGAAWMMVMMFIIGGVLNNHPPDTSSNGKHQMIDMKIIDSDILLAAVSSASIAMIVMVYLYVIGYSASWGPVPWVYASEVFPTRLRSYGVAMAAATQWLFNFCITYMTPTAVHNIGWRIFLMFGIFCLANLIFVYFFIKETKGKTLEDMDIIFGTIDESQRMADVERMVKKTKLGNDVTVELVEMQTTRDEQNVASAHATEPKTT